MAEEAPRVQPLTTEMKAEEETPSSTANKTADPLPVKLRRFLQRQPRLVGVGWTLVALAFLLVVPLVYFSWYDLPIRLWAFATERWWHWLPALLGYIFLFAIPIWGFMAAWQLANFVADVALSLEEAAVHDAQRAVRETEADAIRRLEQTDVAGLLPLLKYSRAQLDAYYAVGLNQTRRSFFNAVLSMWLGFVLLLLGIALFIAPVERLGLSRPQQEFQVVILSGAVIIEVISALFLWVYRSTTAQLTYYYQRQMHTHTAILCFRMASTMQEPDATKRLIVERILAWDEKPERPPVVGAQGLRTLLPGGEAKTA